VEGGPFLNLAWSPGGSLLAAEAENNVWSLYGAKARPSPMPGGARLGRDGLGAEGVVAVAPSVAGCDARRAGRHAGRPAGRLDRGQPAGPGARRPLVFFVHDAPASASPRGASGTVSVLGGDYNSSDAALELTPAMRWMPDGVALLGMRQPTGPDRAAHQHPPPDRRVGPDLYLGPADSDRDQRPDHARGLYFLSRDPDGLAQLWRLPATAARSNRSPRAA
jgi:hypothetical protein